MTDRKETPEEEDKRVAEYFDMLDTPEFKYGVDLGTTFGKQDAYAEAQRAYDAGEIELFLLFHRPKTREGWAAFKAEHDFDELRTRWSKNAED